MGARILKILSKDHQTHLEGRGRSINHGKQADDETKFAGAFAGAFRPMFYWVVNCPKSLNSNKNHQPDRSGLGHVTYGVENSLDESQRPAMGHHIVE